MLAILKKSSHDINHIGRGSKDLEHFTVMMNKFNKRIKNL